MSSRRKLNEPSGEPAVRNSSDATRGEAAAARDRGGKVSGWLRRAGIYAAVGVVIFLLGFAPAWLSARSRAGERDVARRELRRARMENDLAAG
jgi:hypothetical protein